MGFSAAFVNKLLMLLCLAEPRFSNGQGFLASDANRIAKGLGVNRTFATGEIAYPIMDMIVDKLIERAKQGKLCLTEAEARKR